MKYRDHVSSIAELAESEGVFTTAQATRLGIPRDALHDAFESGRLERIVHGAYRLVGSSSRETDELVALWKLTAPKLFTHERIAEWDGICVGGTSAAYLNGIGDLHLSPYRIYSRKRINSRNPSARFSKRDVARRDVSFEQGVPITKPERTVLDLVVDREEPSNVVDVFKEAVESDRSFNYNRLKKLLSNQFGEEEGDRIFRQLRAEVQD